MLCCASKGGTWHEKSDKLHGFRQMERCPHLGLAVARGNKLDIKRYRRGGGAGGYDTGHIVHAEKGWRWAGLPPPAAARLPTRVPPRVLVDMGDGSNN